jgi:GT2 family glycosyltransferase
VIVVNDGTDDLYYLRDMSKVLRVIRNPGSGVAAARNAGVQNAGAEILLFMDDDMWMNADSIACVIKFHEHHEDATLNLNWVYPEDLQAILPLSAFGRFLVKFGFSSLKGWSRGLMWKDTALFKSSGVTSQNLSMRRTTFDRIGGYNTAFPFAGFEDYEFSKRVRDAGVTSYVDPTIMTFHNEADRLDLVSWLDRRARGGYTRQVAVGHGEKDLELHFSFVKTMAFFIIRLFSPAVIRVTTSDLVNRFQFLDPITFRLIDYLLAEAIHRGYVAKDKNSVKSM